MELVAYIRLFRKWFWLIFLGMFLAGGAAFIYQNRQTDQYQTTSKVLVGGFIEVPNPNTAEILTGWQLAHTYAVLAHTYDNLEATVEAGDFPITPGQLNAALDTRVVETTSVLELTITYHDPILAADMANELANQLVLNSPSNLTLEQEQQIELANAEIERLMGELETDRVRRSGLESQLVEETDPAEIDQLLSELSVMANRINDTSANIASYQSTIASIQERTNSLVIVERARIPSSPIGSNARSSTLLGAMVGAALAAGVALLIEYLDDTVRSAEEATRIYSAPSLASISRIGKKRDGYAQRLITQLDSRSSAPEEYRVLRTNLLFAADGRSPCHGFTISSAVAAEGKSVTAANLAVTMANAGKRVLLVDADLRRPRIHEFFDLVNTIGLSTLLTRQGGAEAEGNDSRPYDFLRYVHQTEIDDLYVITSGHLPENPTELLGSVAIQRWYHDVQVSGRFDVVLFDSPPVLAVADSAVLASTLKMPVVIVIEAGRTRRGAAFKTKERLEQLEIEVAGTVINSVNTRNRGQRDGYGYYYYYSDVPRTSGQLQRTED
ncbi:MAG: polysaccharide biosynthesis tyrosine autokinase [Chloroflexi bacterium]|nr:polysaccharide biosynthesis tyrosine autokinase [Chloroflexota bacterium]